MRDAAGEHWPPSEAVLARAIIEHLRSRGWEIYQEVEVAGFGIADIIAAHGRVLLAVEVKCSLTRRVIGQAQRWQQMAQAVTVAVPEKRCNAATDELGQMPERIGVLRRLGIGCLVARLPGEDLRVEVVEHVPHRADFRVSSDRLRGSLREQHKTWAAAGNAEGQRWTPFQETRRRVERAVAARPGLTLSALLAEVPTHYASLSAARTGLMRAIQFGHLPGVRLVERDGVVRLYPVARALGAT